MRPRGQEQDDHRVLRVPTPRRWLPWLAAVCCFAGANLAVAEAPGEYELKAALLYNFARFIEWPAEAFAAPDAPFVIAVVGRDPFGKALDDAVRGRRAGGRPITVVRSSDLGFQDPCHILYLASADLGSLRDDLKRETAAYVLTVSDTPGFASAGGTVGLDLEDQRIHMTFNMTAVRRAGVRVSANLLALARRIEDAP